jgi:hypothetical protein
MQHELLNDFRKDREGQNDRMTEKPLLHGLTDIPLDENVSSSDTVAGNIESSGIVELPAIVINELGLQGISVPISSLNCDENDDECAPFA